MSKMSQKRKLQSNNYLSLEFGILMGVIFSMLFVFLWPLILPTTFIYYFYRVHFLKDYLYFKENMSNWTTEEVEALQKYSDLSPKEAWSSFLNDTNSGRSYDSIQKK